ncbi:MAG: sulfotransferase domain-containing protein [Geminicoccaceae bacterium]
MPCPTFLILGTSKAGSTSLYHYLSQHRDVFMSEPKEPPFFRMEYERGAYYYWQSYFKGYGGEKEIGDACTQNLHLPFVARRIADTLPEARLFVLCRNPVERAVSAYWDNYSHGLEPLSLEAALEKNLRRLETGPCFEDEAEASLYARVAHQGNKALQRAYGFYVEPGYYAEHIERYRALFGKDRMQIIFFEDLTRDAPRVVAEAQRFLELEPRSLGDTSPQNRAMSRTAALFCSAVGHLPGISRFPAAWRTEVKRRMAGRFRGTGPEISDAALHILLEHFRPHNQRLAQLTGRNLEHWN